MTPRFLGKKDAFYILLYDSEDGTKSSDLPAGVGVMTIGVIQHHRRQRVPDG